MLFRVIGKITGNVPFAIRVEAANAIAATSLVKKALNDAGKSDDDVLSLVSSPMKAGKGEVHFGKALTDEEIAARKAKRAEKKASAGNTATAPATGKKK